MPGASGADFFVVGGIAGTAGETGDHVLHAFDVIENGIDTPKQLPARTAVCLPAVGALGWSTVASGNDGADANRAMLETATAADSTSEARMTFITYLDSLGLAPGTGFWTGLPRLTRFARIRYAPGTPAGS